MHAKHNAVAALLQALSEHPERPYREAGRLRWSVVLSEVGSAACAASKFLNAFADDVRLLEVNQSHTAVEDMPTLKEQDSVSFEVWFNVNDNLFLTLSEAKDYYVTASAKPVKFFVFDGCVVASENMVPPGWGLFVAHYNLMVDFFNSLEKLAHHKGQREAIFVDPSDKNFPSLAISTEISKIYFEDKQLFEKINIPNFISMLAKGSERENSHYLKELSVFRASLFELLSPVPKNNDPVHASIFLLKNLSEFEKIYRNNFQAYISGLSLEKLKNELATEQMKMSDQATAGLMDISGKMFALPAVIGLTRMPMFNDMQDLGNIVIVITCLILLLPLFSQKRQLNTIKHSNSLAFKALDQKIQRERGNAIGDELDDIRKNLSKTIKSVSITLDIFILLAMLPILYIVDSTGMLDVIFGITSPFSS